MTRPNIAHLLAAAGLLAMVVGCEPSRDYHFGGREQPTVTVDKPAERDVQDVADFNGRVEAVQRVEVRAPVGGFLVSVATYTNGQVDDFREGSLVNKGDLLFVVGQEVSEIAQLIEAEAAKETLEAELQPDRPAEPPRGRASLYSRRSREEEKKPVHPKVAQAQARVDEIKSKIHWTEIRAPITGIIGERLVDLGNWVSQDQRALLATIVSMDAMHVYFDVDARVFNELRRQRQSLGGGSARIIVGLAVDDEEGYPHRGQLDYLGHRVDPTTGTAVARALFTNEDDRLYPGQTVRVRVPLAMIKGALLVRERSLGTDLGGDYVFVVQKDDTVQRRPVEPGIRVGDMRVVNRFDADKSSGLSRGDRYIVDAQQSVRSGSAVRTVEAEELERSREEAEAEAEAEAAP